MEMLAAHHLMQKVSKYCVLADHSVRGGVG